MTTLRTEKNANYTTINNTVLNDPDLSWEAKGLAAYLFSKPDNWRISVNQLWGASTNGVGAVKRMLRELEDHGYLRRRRYRNAAGTFEWEQVLYETPQPPEPADDDEDPPQPEEAPAADSTIGRKPSDGFPSDGKPSNGFPSDGNPSHIVSTDHQVLRPSTDHQILKTTDRPHARANQASSSSSRPGRDAGRAANVSRETRPEPGAAQHRTPQATVTAKSPPPPLAAPPLPPTPAADAGQLGAVAAALLENDWCDDADGAGRQALALVGEGHPAEDVIHCAVHLDKSRARDRIAFLRGVLERRKTEGRRDLRSRARGELTDEERRRLYAAPQAQLQLEPVSRETPADPLDEGQPAVVDEDPPALGLVAAALERAHVPMAETHAAQLLATFGHLQPAQLVATIAAAAAAAPPGKAPSLMGIRNQLRQLHATEAR